MVSIDIGSNIATGVLSRRHGDEVLLGLEEAGCSRIVGLVLGRETALLVLSWNPEERVKEEADGLIARALATLSKSC